MKETAAGAGVVAVAVAAACVLVAVGGTGVPVAVEVARVTVGVIVAVGVGVLGGPVGVLVATLVLVTTGVLVATGVLVGVGVGQLTAATLTAEKVTVLEPLRLCAVTAGPASSVPVSALSVTVEPGTSVHAVPLLEVQALKVVPARLTSR